MQIELIESIQKREMIHVKKFSLEINKIEMML